MNVAASTLIVLGMLLPGIAFRRFYYTGEFSKQYFTENVGQLLLPVFVPAVALQLLFYTLARIAGADAMVAGVDALLGQAFLRATDIEFGYRTAVQLALGQVGLTAFASALGYALQIAVRLTGIDRRVKLFRFRNHWHYVLRGGLREFPGVTPLLLAPPRGVLFTYVDVLAQTSEGDALYEGILADYELLPDNKLDKLVLLNARRRYLSQDKLDSTADPAGRYAIPGDFFVLPAEGIRNVNVRYVTDVQLDGALLRLSDADGDVTSASYYNAPDAP